MFMAQFYKVIELVLQTYFVLPEIQAFVKWYFNKDCTTACQILVAIGSGSMHHISHIVCISYNCIVKSAETTSWDP